MAKPSKKKEHRDELLVAQNRAASYNYHLLEKLEAGMVLLGTEVKSLREGKANLRDGYAVIRGNAVWLLNCHIGEYLPGGMSNHSPLRPRKLLLNSAEIEKLDRKTDAKGLTIIPLKIYFRDGLAKCEIALAQGKKKWDRRQTERDKEAKREVGEAMYDPAIGKVKDEPAIFRRFARVMPHSTKHNFILEKGDPWRSR